MTSSCFRSMIILLFLFASEVSIGQAKHVDHIDMKLTLSDSIMDVQARYSAIAKDSGNSLFFLLNPGYTIDQIHADGLDTFQLGQKPGRPIPFWELTFDREIIPGEKIDLYFLYSFDMNNQNHLQSNWIELNVDKFWFPNHDDLDNVFTYNVSIIGLPDSISLVGSMDVDKTWSDSGLTMANKKPDKEILILGGGNMREWRLNDTVTFFAHSSIEDSLLRSMNKKVIESIRLLNATIGISDPIDTFLVVIRNTTSDEIGFQFSRGNMIITGPDFNDHANLSHEIAHYWWSKADFINEPWINEAFANYSMFEVLRSYDPSSYKRIIERYTKKAEKAPPVGTTTIFSENAYDAYYIKGAVLLIKLEERIGRSMMEKLLEYMVREEIASTDGFLNALEHLTDTETKAFFIQLLEE